MKYIVANWKSNKTITEAREWLKKITNYKLQITNLEIIIAAPFTVLSSLQETDLPFKLAAQNISPFPSGSYTGEISAAMLKNLVDYSIVGHSERRRYFRETDKEISLKVAQALKHQIIPILAFSKLNQIKVSVKDLKQKERKKVLLMYEPTNAISKQVGPIGVGQAASLKKVLPMIKKVKQLFPQNEVLYGGSVKSDNIVLYLAQLEINGVVSGSASQNAEEFIKMLQLSSQAV